MLNPLRSAEKPHFAHRALEFPVIAQIWLVRMDGMVSPARIISSHFVVDGAPKYLSCLISPWNYGVFQGQAETQHRGNLAFTFEK